MAPVQASNDRILLAQEDLQALRMGVEPFLPVACKNAGRLWPLTLEQTLPLADPGLPELAIAAEPHVGDLRFSLDPVMSGPGNELLR